MFVPLLPTTPFLILTAMCFNKGSKEFHNWLIHHRVLGPPILDWKQYQVIRTKFKTLATLMILISSYFVYTKETIPAIGKAVFAVFVFSVLLFIWTRKGSPVLTQSK